MWFHFQAAGRLMSRRKGPVVRMIVVALVASAWCIAGAMWALGTWREANDRASAMTIDVVCDDYLSPVGVKNLAATIARKPGVVEATVQSSDAVWKEFATELRIADQDLRGVALLPTLIRVRLSPELVTQHDVERIVAELRQGSKRAIASITWPRTYVVMVEELRRTLMVFGGAAGILSFVLFGVGVAYAFKAEVHRAGSDLRVAELLGAPMQWIAAPHTIVGLLAGALGILISVGAVVSIHSYARYLASWVGRVTTQEILLASASMACIGAFISWGQSLLAVREAMRQR